MSDDEGLCLEIVGGVNQEMVPFCVVEINGKEVGQLPPSQVRSMALQWLGAAANATADAAIVRALKNDVGLDLPTIAGFLASLRDHRQNADADADEADANDGVRQ